MESMDYIYLTSTQRQKQRQRKAKWIKHQFRQGPSQFVHNHGTVIRVQQKNIQCAGYALFYLETKNNLDNCDNYHIISLFLRRL